MPENNVNSEIPEPHHSRRTGLFLPLLLLVMGAYPPLSTDLYLPALPEIAAAFNTTDSMVSLTLVLFFVFFAFSTLIWGPVSDKFGRKPALFAGIGLYTLASAGCAWAPSIHQMIFWRVLQALGAGAPVTVSIAIVQDTYQGQARKNILAILGALMMVAPVIGPAVGSTLLVFAGWRTIFVILLLLGLFSLAGCLIIAETAPGGRDRTVVQAFTGLFTVLKFPFFRRALMVFSLPAVYVLGFVGGSAMIFMSEFGQSRNAFSVYFAINAAFAIIGSALYIPASRWFRMKTTATVGFLAITASGILMVCLGRTGPIVFLLCVIPGTLTTSLLRPLSMDLMMDAGGPDSGAASSLINFVGTLVGSLGIQLLAMAWHSRILFYGVMATALGTCCLSMWPWVYKKRGNP